MKRILAFLILSVCLMPCMAKIYDTGMAEEPIRNVWLSNIRLNYRGEDQRPVVVLDDVSHASLRGIDAENQPVGAADVVTYDCRDVRVME